MARKLRLSLRLVRTRAIAAGLSDQYLQFDADVPEAGGEAVLGPHTVATILNAMQQLGYPEVALLAHHVDDGKRD